MSFPSLHQHPFMNTPLPFTPLPWYVFFFSFLSSKSMKLSDSHLAAYSTTKASDLCYRYRNSLFLMDLLSAPSVESARGTLESNWGRGLVGSILNGTEMGVGLNKGCAGSYYWVKSELLKRYIFFLWESAKSFEAGPICFRCVWFLPLLLKREENTFPIPKHLFCL